MILERGEGRGGEREGERNIHVRRETFIRLPLVGVLTGGPTHNLGM